MELVQESIVYLITQNGEVIGQYGSLAQAILFADIIDEEVSIIKKECRVYHEYLEERIDWGKIKVAKQITE